MNTTKIRTAVVATIAVIGIALTGCTTEAPENEPTTRPGTTQTDTPTTEPTDEPTEPETPAYTVGQILTEVPADLGEMGTFQLDDGTYIVVDPYQPLPQVVVDQAAAMVPQPSADPDADDWGSQGRAASAAAGRVQRTTGKLAIAIYSIIGSKTFDGPMETLYCLSGAAMPADGCTPDKAAAIAAGEAFIAAQGEPARWVLVYTP